MHNQLHLLFLLLACFLLTGRRNTLLSRGRQLIGGRRRCLLQLLTGRRLWQLVYASEGLFDFRIACDFIFFEDRFFIRRVAYQATPINMGKSIWLARL